MVAAPGGVVGTVMVIETGGAVVTGAGVDGACEDGVDMHPADSIAAIRTRATAAPGITKVLVCIPFTILDLILNLGAAVSVKSAGREIKSTSKRNSQIPASRLFGQDPEGLRAFLSIHEGVLIIHVPEVEYRKIAYRDF